MVAPLLESPELVRFVTVLMQGYYGVERVPVPLARLGEHARALLHWSRLDAGEAPEPDAAAGAHPAEPTRAPCAVRLVRAVSRSAPATPPETQQPLHDPCDDAHRPPAPADIARALDSLSEAAAGLSDADSGTSHRSPSDDPPQRPASAQATGPDEPSVRPAANAAGASADLLLALVARRSRLRAGVRYLRRGVDEAGNVANFVETEQIVEWRGHRMSFVQTRGSVPVFWHQPGGGYKPRATVDTSRGEDAVRAAFLAHMEQQYAAYGQQYLVNLLNRHGQERAIGDAYHRQAILAGCYETGARLRYIAFDFHAICKGFRYGNVNILLDALSHPLREVQHLWVSPDGEMLNVQRGVLRTNCMDCLDRTNVVQMAIASRALHTQLLKLGLLDEQTGVPLGPVIPVLRALWTASGDAISRLYAGTDAMKRDFTRTGRRGMPGVVSDGYNLVARYLQNTFRDRYRQIVIDLQQEACSVEHAVADLFAHEQQQTATAAALSSSPSSAVEAAGRDRQPAAQLGSESAAGAVEWPARAAGTIQRGPSMLRRRRALEDAAIETVASLLLPPGERRLGGWHLVQLLGHGAQRDVFAYVTHTALYIAHWDATGRTVEEFDRIPLTAILHVRWGPLSLSSKLSVAGLLSQSAVKRQTGMRLFCDPSRYRLVLHDEARSYDAESLFFGGVEDQQQPRAPLASGDVDTLLDVDSNAAGGAVEPPAGAEELTLLSPPLSSPQEARVRISNVVQALGSRMTLRRGCAAHDARTVQPVQFSIVHGDVEIASRFLRPVTFVSQPPALLPVQRPVTPPAGSAPATPTATASDAAASRTPRSAASLTAAELAWWMPEDDDVPPLV